MSQPIQLESAPRTQRLRTQLICALIAMITIGVGAWFNGELLLRGYPDAAIFTVCLASLTLGGLGGLAVAQRFWALACLLGALGITGLMLALMEYFAHPL